MVYSSKSHILVPRHLFTQKPRLFEEQAAFLEGQPGSETCRTGKVGAGWPGLLCPLCPALGFLHKGLQRPQALCLSAQSLASTRADGLGWGSEVTARPVPHCPRHYTSRCSWPGLTIIPRHYTSRCPWPGLTIIPWLSYPSPWLYGPCHPRVFSCTLSCSY